MKNTTENNRLIAVFLGMSYDNHNAQPNKYWELTDEQPFVSSKAYPQDKDLQFHSSWGWLMPVVEKINGLKIQGAPEIRIGKFFTELFYSPNNENKSSVYRISSNLTKIQTVYLSCAEFIKWHNQQK